MAGVADGIINIEINTGDAAAQLQQLQRQINSFNLALNTANKAQANFAKDYAKDLQDAINKTGAFTAEAVRLSTAAQTLDKTLSKGQATLGQFFSAKFNKDSAAAAEVMSLAADRAARMQTQFIATSGAAKGMQDALAIRPLAAFSSEVAISAQKTEILSSMLKQGTTQLINFGKNVQWSGRQLMVGFTVPLTIFGNTAAKTFLDLEKQVVSFKKVYGDMFTTPAELDKNLQAVQDLGKEYTKYGIAVKDTISLAAQAAAAGRTNKDLTDSVTQATRLATLGQMDQNAALETTISLQSAFKLSGKDLADTINFLNMVENQTVVSLQDISAAIPRVAPVIQGLGGDVKDLTVFLAAMQEGGVGAEEGANALKSGLASLINPTKQAQEVLNGLGINLNAIVQANKGDLMGTVMAFSQALSSLDQFQRQQALEQVFGKFQYAKLGALFENISRTGSQAQQVIATMAYSTEQLGKTADKELRTIEESFGARLTSAVEKFKVAIAPIGQMFLEIGIPVINFITNLVDKFNGLSEGQKKFIAIATVITGVVIPAGTMFLGLLMNLTGTLAKFIQNFGAFTKGLLTGGPIGAIKALTQSSAYLSTAEMDAALAAQQLSNSSNDVTTALIEQATTAGIATTAINNLAAAYQALVITQAEAAQYSTYAIPGAAAETARKNPRVQRRNSGGPIVPGSGNTDTVPAMLTPGEFVVNKKATQNNLGLLHAINGGNVRGYNNGDIVTSLMRPFSLSRHIGENTASISPRKRISQRSQVIAKSERAHTTSPVLKTLTEDLMTARGPIPAGSQVMFLSNRVLDIGGNQQLKEGGRGLAASSVLSDIESRGLSIFKTMDDQFAEYARNSYNSQIESGVGQEEAKKNVKEMVKQYYRKRREVFASYVDNLSSMGDTIVKDNDFSKISDRAFASFDSNPHTKDFHQRLMEHGSVRFNVSTLKETAKNLGVDVSGQKTRKQMLNTINEFLVASGKTPIEGTAGMGGTFALGKKGLFYERFGKGSGRSKLIKLLGALTGRKMNAGGPVFMSSGSTVPGVGNTDTVPAMLTPGEFVVNKNATKKNLGLLHAINGSKATNMNKGGVAQHFALGGLVKTLLPVLGGMGLQGIGASSENELLQTLGQVLMFGGIPMGGISKGGGMKLASRTFNVAKAGGAGNTQALMAATKQLLPKITMASVRFAGIAGALVAGTYQIYKWNKDLNKAQDASAELARAMYGTAKKTNDMADFFGRQTFAQQAAIAGVEKAAGTTVSAEAQQAGTGFVQSAAGQQMLKDVQTVRNAGGNAAEALRNQLASGIIAGAITPEEANAIAAEIGTALKDTQLSMSVAGQLTQLLGPDGKDVLKNLSTITAEITPTIDAGKLATDAQSAYEKLNIGQKFVQFFKGGADAFKEGSVTQGISEQLTVAYEKERDALALLNLAYQNGTISLKEYEKQKDALSGATGTTQEAAAKALGFNSYKDLIAASETKGTVVASTRGGTRTTYTAEQEKARIFMKQQRGSAQSFLEQSGFTGDSLTAVMTQLDKIGETSFGKLLTGELQIQNIDIMARFASGGLDQAGLDKVNDSLNMIANIPNIDRIINFKSAGADEVNAVYDLYTKVSALDTVEKQVDFVYQETGFEMTKDQYNQFAALPDEQRKAFITEYITKKAEIDTKISVAIDEGGKSNMIQVANMTKQLDNLMGDLLGSYTKVNSSSKKLNDTLGGGGSGSTKGRLKELKAQLIERFTLMDKMLTLEAKKYEDLIRIKERENDLDQRGLELISKQEEKINKIYDDKLESLDKIGQANERLKSQEQDRVNLAQALARGDLSAAAQAASTMAGNEAQYRIEDARAALEKQREEDIKNIRVSVNGVMVTREQIEDRMWQRQQEMYTIQDKLYAIEEKRRINAEAREKIETRLMLLEQKKYIADMKAKKSKLSTAEKKDLKDYITSYNELVGEFNSTFGGNMKGISTKLMYGGKVAKYAFGSNGGVPGLGNIDKVPALLTPGEFVVKKASAQAFMPLLNAINGDLFPQINGPRYNVPNGFNANMPQNVSQNATTMYNDTYNINVSVDKTNVSAEEIASVVMKTISQQNRSNANVRGVRF